MNNTYSKVWRIHKIPKSMHLSHGLSLLTTDIPISLANSSYRWQASRVSCGRYRICCLLVKGGRLMRFISLLEGEDEGSRKVFIQFLCHCCSMEAMRSTSKCLAKSLWRSSSLCHVSSSFCFFHASSSNLFRSAIFRLFVGLALEAFLFFLLSKQGFCLSTSSHQLSLIRLIIGVREVSDQDGIEGHSGRISGLKVYNEKILKPESDDN